ncbi:hypothetical protein CC80DRAFT_249561 [Byssothecium circinans]|uniref:Uncharacterized protein n=1 Tax=Byssothecium circinans TaxID=147558 RepID=A0A6A5TEC7_9PLEO|nr:hypothetical protein CC80DRAFT_249561 [Byssothecium circinans]
MNCVWSSIAQERRLYRQEPTLSRNGTEPSGTVKYCSVQQLEAVGTLEEAVEQACRYSNWDAMLLYISALVQQRQELASLAAEHDISVPADRLLDAQAQSIIDELEARGVFIHPSLKPTRPGIYYFNISQWYTETLETLYNAGFHDILGEEFTKPKIHSAISPLFFILVNARRTYTPMNLEKIVSWFLGHGANIRETWPGSDITLLHCAGFRLGNAHSITTLGWLELGSYVTDRQVDDCRCPCSSSGCSFITCLCKGLTTPELQDTRIPWRDELDILTRYVGVKTREGENRWLISETIRLVVFNKLDIRHTCCNIARIMQHDAPGYTIQPKPRYPDSVDLQAVQEEDAPLVSLQEDLIQKYEGWWDTPKSHKGIYWFVELDMLPDIECTLRRMEEEERKFYAEGRRELGVLMSDDDEEEESDENDEGSDCEIEFDSEDSSDVGSFDEEILRE